MTELTVDGWERIAAESELRPRSGPVTGVPGHIARLTPAQPELPQPRPQPPIGTDQVPDVTPEPAPPDPAAGPMIRQVPYQAEPVFSEPVAVIDDTPLVVSEPTVEEPPQLVTEVPDPEPDLAPVISALPDQGQDATSIPWWRLMLGGGGSEQPPS